MSKAKKYVVATLGILAALALLAWSPWNRFVYHGDGTFSDRGFFYPRYRIRLPDVSLSEEAEHHFRLFGLPHEQMLLVLLVNGYQSPEDRELFVQLPATIEAKLTDGSGNVACDAVGRPADSNQDGVWILSSDAYLWHYRCNFVQVHTFRSYDLMIRVSSIGKMTRRVSVTPILEGGGVELP